MAPAPRFDRLQAEVLLKVAIAGLVGTSLAVFGTARRAGGVVVVPPSTAALVPIFGAGVFAVSFPKLAFVAGSVYPEVVVWFTVAFALSSLVLLGATVSDGLYVAVFAVLAFIVQSCYFGRSRKKLSPAGSIMCALMGVVSSPLRATVQDGVTISTPLSKVDSFSFLPNLCEQHDCSAPFNATAVIPADVQGPLAGKTAYVSVINETVTARIAGGPWLVSALWTEWRADTLSVYRNLYIALAWAIFVALLATFLPPVHTMRSALISGAVPGAIAKSIELLRLTRSAIQPSYAGELVVGRHEEEPAVRDSVAAAAEMEASKKEADRDTAFNDTLLKAVKTWKTVSAPEQAATIVFEPRVYCKPSQLIVSFECDVVPYLKKILVEADRTLAECIVTYVHSVPNRTTATKEIASGGSSASASSDDGLDDVVLCENGEPVTAAVEDVASVDRTITLLKSIAEALKEQDPRLIQDYKKFRIMCIEGTVPSRRSLYESQFEYIYAFSERLAATAISWLSVYKYGIGSKEEHDEDEKGNGAYASEARTRMCVACIPMTVFCRMLELLKLSLNPRKWSLTHLFWSLKLTVGFVVLVVMDVYWRQYSALSIGIGGGGMKSNEPLFADWAFIAYAMTWRPTVEGTIKKGLQVPTEFERFAKFTVRSDRLTLSSSFNSRRTAAHEAGFRNCFGRARWVVRRRSGKREWKRRRSNKPIRFSSMAYSFYRHRRIASH